MKYGKTRWKDIGDGEVIALLPKCSEKEFKDYLAHIADEYRENLDEIPERLYIFRYEIDLEDNFALITLEEKKDGQSLFSEDYGYIEQKIGNLKDFKEFMSRIDDNIAVAFMKEFYKNIQKYPRDIALQKTQKAALENDLPGCGKTEAPFLWSGFNLYGDYKQLKFYHV